MKSLPTYMATVNSAETARAFLSALHADGLLFHPEENPLECLTHHNLPTCNLLRINGNMAACFRYLTDPCEAALEIMA